MFSWPQGTHPAAVHSGYNPQLSTTPENQHTMRYHLTWVRMTILKRSTNNKFWRWCGKNGTLLHCWWEYKLVQPLWRLAWRFLRKPKTELPWYPVSPLLGMYLGKTILWGSSHCGAVETNPTRNHRVVGLIPGLTQWVKDPALQRWWNRRTGAQLLS